MQMFFSFFHPVSEERHWSFLFHPPFFSRNNYSFYNLPEQILFRAGRRCKDETKYDCPTHGLKPPLSSIHSNATCTRTNKPLYKNLLSNRVNQEREWHYPNAV